MAILSEIRNRSMFLILIIGLALFAFVLDPSSFGSSKVEQIGEVNGEVITREDFASRVEQYKTNSRGNTSQSQATNAVWNQMVSEKIYAKQLEEAGIVLGEEDVWNTIVNSPSVQNNPTYKNEAGLFDEDKFKEAVALIKDNASGNSATSQAKAQWLSWLNYENSVEENLKKQVYTNLVKSGLGVSLEEAKGKYFLENTKINGQFVYLPYTGVSDSLVKVSDTDIKKYIDTHKTQFQVEASRNLKYVQFETKATVDDEAIIKNDLTTYVSDFKKSTDNAAFVEESNSDLPEDANFKFKDQLAASVADQIINGEIGTVFGPYKDKDYYKISKISDIKKMPDSVKASHILIAFVGSRSATADTKETEEQAKKTADSLLTIVKRDVSKFANLAKDFSMDKSNAEKGGELDWFVYTSMVPEFRDYSFSNNTGDIAVVKTVFGFHIVKIDGQKNTQKAVQLATISKKIIPSEATESKVYETVESFLAALTDNTYIDALAKEKNYTVKQAQKIKVLDETIPGLTGQRQIVTWAFDKDTKKETSKRFDLDNGGFVVAIVTETTKKGLAPVADVASQVRPILRKEKKAKILENKLQGSSLDEIAKANNTTVRKASNVTIESPTLSGVGREPAIVGAMYTLKDGDTSTSSIVGEKGVFVVKTISKELPVDLPNYNASKESMTKALKNASSGLFYKALKKVSNIKDDRSALY